MATHVSASSVFPLPIERVWTALRVFTYPQRLLPSVVQSAVMLHNASPVEVGAVRELRWRSGELRQQRLLELSDQFFRLSWETILAEPVSETAASQSSIRLRRVSEDNSTLVEWQAEFSADVKAEAIKFEQKALQANLKEMRSELQRQQRVLVLGAGLVARPLVAYLSEKGYHVTVASRTLDKVRKLVTGLKNVEAVECDVENDAGLVKLEELAPKTDMVISMLPYLFHPRAAKVAIKHGKHFLTTSYVSPGMRELEAEAKAKGLVLINECGVDPGTDHMSAMRVIHDVKHRGGKVVSFTSYCGGLPAPDANNNPFGYKLSWAPRGVLLASRNDAHFLRDGTDVTIQGKDLFDNYEVHDVQGMTLEAYPNRNSKQYIEIYEVPHTRTMIRGTYRNRNWCATVKKLVDLGFLDVTERNDLAGRTYANVVAALLAVPETADLKAEVAKRLSLKAEQAFVTDNMAWLGLFSASEKVGVKVTTLLDAVCQLFVEKLQYAPGERDMLVMQHKFEAEFADHRESIISSLVDYGIANGDTSMSRTVSLPVAIAARLVLEGSYTRAGLSIPTCPELYVPILNELETFNIRFIEKTVKHMRTGGPGSH